MSGARTSRWCGLAPGRQPNPTIGEGTRLKIRLGVDVACGAVHQASLADEQGRFLFVGHRFRTGPDELDTGWARLPKDAERRWSRLATPGSRWRPGSAATARRW